MSSDNHPADKQSSSSKIGTGMFVLAWLVGLGLVSLLFEDSLLAQFNPNETPDAQYENGKPVVNLKRNRYGHYVATGKINGQEVVFLVDTGATSVSIPVDIARQLNLQPGAPGRSQTANGTVTVYRTQIPVLELGNIKLNNVVGNINPGMQGPEILLGMSVLKQLEFTQRQDTLTLRPL